MPVSRAADSDTFTTTTPSDREITLSRLFDAPPDLVFEAMTKPEHVRKWWGILDDRYSVTQCEIDLRPGGTWKFVGRTPRGEVCFYGEYREIDAPDDSCIPESFAVPERGIGGHADAGAGRPQDRLTVTARYSSLEVRDMVLGTGMEHGAAISYGRRGNQKISNQSYAIPSSRASAARSPVSFPQLQPPDQRRRQEMRINPANPAAVQPTVAHELHNVNVRHSGRLVHLLVIREQLFFAGPCPR